MFIAQMKYFCTFVHVNTELVSCKFRWWQFQNSYIFADNRISLDVGNKLVNLPLAISQHCESTNPLCFDVF